MNASGQNVLIECLSSHPIKTPNLTLAKILCKAHPNLFPTLETTRGAIRYYRGQSGKRHRRNIATTTFIRPKGSQHDKPDEAAAAEARGLEPIEKKALRILSARLKHKEPISVVDLADKLDCSPCAATNAVKKLLERGYNVATNPDNKIELATVIQQKQPLKIDTEDYFGDGWVRFGLVADTHLCFPHSTPVQTDCGEKRIYTIKVGDMVLTHLNRYRKVLKVIESPGDGQYVRIRFRGKVSSGTNGKASLVCTPNHPILVVRRGVEGFIPASEIQAGDAVRMLAKSCRDCDNPRTKLKNRKFDWLPANENGFIGAIVTSAEPFKSRSTKVYNLIVEEDETYIAKRCVVHNCSRYERLDVLNALYDVFEREGLRTVYHCGNWIDGEARFNKYDLHCIGVESQIAYFLKNYPQRKNVATGIISGDDHEGWYVQGSQVNIGKVMQDRAEASGRKDLKDLGYMERDIVFKRGRGESVVRIIHAGGGSTYAISYTSQKYVESLQGGEKPTMVCVGHFHKFDWSYPREVQVVQPGCCQDQTPFMRKKRIQAMVGGCIVEAKQDNRGCFVRVKVEWMPFFDKTFYSYKWS
jgi:DNA-binding Lrp family transcriptional regulator